MTYGMSVEDKLDNWAKYSTAGQKAVLQEASKAIRHYKEIIKDRDDQYKILAEYNTANNAWGTTLFQALENLYNDYAEYYPSAIENSPAMKAAYELINEERESEE